MRCLSLAERLKSKGVECRFICKPYIGNLAKLISERGFAVHLLEAIGGFSVSEGEITLFDKGAQYLDANASAYYLHGLTVDWVIVDHYALDEVWENCVRPNCKKVMVIDDLANRKHNCDILLDQTFGRNREDYQQLVPPGCEILCGVDYVLLRREFSEYRGYSLNRRRSAKASKLLVTMGGVDKGNITGKILSVLDSLNLTGNPEVYVVLGEYSPALEFVQQQADEMNLPVKVLVAVNNMAELMSECDLAIGAAGSTSWERCTLGLPTIMVVLADNQKLVARNLSETGAVKLLEADELVASLPKVLVTLFHDDEKLAYMSEASAATVTGHGVFKVMNALGVS